MIKQIAAFAYIACTASMAVIGQTMAIDAHQLVELAGTSWMVSIWMGGLAALSILCFWSFSEKHDENRIGIVPVAILAFCAAVFFSLSEGDALLGRVSGTAILLITAGQIILLAVSGKGVAKIQKARA